ncbi:hypothetical protein Ate01nite_35800 [Actinoplanes teichomyceticus]|nr:hypothetical protein Ate01nite_35800 [Actinoplanes teichomyceticus]
MARVSFPDVVAALGSKIGPAPLPLNGVIAVVLDGRNRVLPVRRSDNGQWALTTGCRQPGEQPADGALVRCSRKPVSAYGWSVSCP